MSQVEKYVTGREIEAVEILGYFIAGTIYQ